MNVIEVSGLKKYYRSEFWLRKSLALEGMSFSVREGKITGFLGANGAGKSTTIKCILGLLLPDEGEIHFFGDKKISPEVKKRIGFLPERPFFYEYLEGREFLEFYAKLTGMENDDSLKKRIDHLMSLVGLSHAKGKKLKEYSKGMLQRIGIAQAIVHDPDLVILDEPMSGLDPDGRYEVSEIIRNIAAQGKSVFFSSHLLHDVEKLCEDVIILKSGELKYQGPLGPLVGDLSHGYQIAYFEGEEKKITSVADVDSLQLELDRIRKNRGAVVSVDQKRKSLEDAYVAINQLDSKETI